MNTKTILVYEDDQQDLDQEDFSEEDFEDLDQDLEEVEEEEEP